MKQLIFLVLFIGVLDCDAQKSEYEDIKIEILENSELKKFLHLELESRTPVFLYKNEWIEDDLSLEGLSYKTLIVNDTTGTNGNVIRFSKLHAEESVANFSLYYKVENMSMSGTLIKTNDRWEIEKIDEIIEF